MKSRRSKSKKFVRSKRLTSRKSSSLKKSGSEFFLLNPNFEFFQELRSLVLKSSPDERNRLAKKISVLGRVKLAIVSGIFLNTMEDSALDTQPVADLFIVGDDINKRKLTNFLQSLEAEVGKEIKFGLMEREEFEYRFSMFDRFVRVLLEGPHEKIINKLEI
ncbi:MAG: hypothetical protein AAB479_03080 [Patescibacteria group bacterium]